MHINLKSQLELVSHAKMQFFSSGLITLPHPLELRLERKQGCTRLLHGLSYKLYNKKSKWDFTT